MANGTEWGVSPDSARKSGPRPAIAPDKRRSEPELANIVADDLEVLRLPRLEVLYRQGVERDWWADSEFHWRELVCAAVHAKRVGEDPVKLFAYLTWERFKAARAEYQDSNCAAKREPKRKEQLPQFEVDNEAAWKLVFGEKTREPAQVVELDQGAKVDELIRSVVNA